MTGGPVEQCPACGGMHMGVCAGPSSVTRVRWEGRHCSDHGCVWGHPGGMGTNGGCQHLKGDRHEIRRTLLYMSRELLALRAERDALRARVRQAMREGSAEDMRRVLLPVLRGDAEGSES